MMEEENDRMLEEFFKKAQELEIPDDGFSDSVMEKVMADGNRRMVVMMHIWTTVCVVSGILVILFSGIVNRLPSMASRGISYLLYHVMPYAATFLKHISTIDMTQIAKFAFFVPLGLALLFAVVALGNEKKLTRII